MPQHIWKIPSLPPHDFYLGLDVDSYFDHEHHPEEIFENGFTRPVPLTGRDILVTIFFNGDVEQPEFTVRAHDTLTLTEEAEATAVIRRILGTGLDMSGLYEQAADDPVLAPLFQELYGLKRISRASFFEDALNRIIQTQIKHKPTARKMVYNVRSAYGTRLESGVRPVAGVRSKLSTQTESEESVIPAWPRPEKLILADPAGMKKHGLSLRKGEFIVGLAHELVSGNLDTGEIEAMSPKDLYERLIRIRGIGPTTAQDLVLFRNRTDCFFPSNIERGREKAIRQWIILSYGEDPDHCDESRFQQIIRRWKGYEAVAIEFLYVSWITSEKRKSQQS